MARKPAVTEQPETTVAEASQVEHREPGDEPAKKEYATRPNPHSLMSRLLPDGSRIHLLLSQNNDQRYKGVGAWIIRMDKKPDEMESYSKENPHPVKAFLKSDGYRWGFDEADNIGGWGKYFNGDQRTASMEAERTFNKAAELMGAKVEAERVPY